jgi:ketosteroid isomerase-like protein
VAASATDIAAQLRAVADDRVASSELLASLFAEEVELRHTPASPFDGPIPGAALADAVRGEVQAVAQAMPDATHEPGDITVEGEGVRMRSSVSGTLADGTPVEVRTDTLLTIAGGSIVALGSDMDAATMELWGRVLAEGAAGAAGATDEQAAPTSA